MFAQLKLQSVMKFARKDSGTKALFLSLFPPKTPLYSFGELRLPLTEITDSILETTVCAVCVTACIWAVTHSQVCRLDSVTGGVCLRVCCL